ncbi:MAG: hypothetical protein U9Q66_01300 [Patescibacteria group bacterium]|nr:hypothetical protein [Patescibacteria group bacterium]
MIISAFQKISSLLKSYTLISCVHSFENLAQFSNLTFHSSDNLNVYEFSANSHGYSASGSLSENTNTEPS